MFFFRADSNKNIASGHIMRCISIALELISRKQSVMFLIADQNPVEMLSRYKMPYMVLNSCWSDLSIEVGFVKEILKSNTLPVLIIDTYSVNKAYIEQLSEFAIICYLGSKKEDLGELDLLINYNAYIDYTFYRTIYSPRNTVLLLGVRYAPLRKEFQSVKNHIKNNIDHILITTGNTDPVNVTGDLLSKLIECEIVRRCQIDVVIGSMFAFSDSLLSNYGKIENIIFHENTASMSKLMMQSDLAISANGTTVYELAASYVPTITFSIVSEQEISGRALDDLGIVDYCGAVFNDTENTLKKIINRLIFYFSYDDERKKLARNAKIAIDGYGCKRISDELIRLSRR